MYPLDFINEIRARVTVLKDHPIENLVRRDELGERYSFIKLKPHLEQIIKLFFHVNNFDLENLLTETIDTIDRVSKETAVLFTTVKHFQAVNDAQEMHEQISKQIIDFTKDLASEMFPIVNYYRLGELEKKPSEAKSKINEILEHMNGIVKEAIEKSKEQNRIVEETRSAAGQVSISRHSNLFEEQAKSHKKLSRVWLAITGVLTVITLWVGRYFVKLYLDDITVITTGQAIQRAVAKLIVFGVLSYAIVWAGKVYRAHQHNNVVNTHRQNALRTFEAFVEAIEGDQDIKDAILLRASETIFAPQSSGFLTQEPEPMTSTKVWEIFRGGDH